MSSFIVYLFILSYLLCFFPSDQQTGRIIITIIILFHFSVTMTINDFFIFFIHTRVLSALAPKRPLVFVPSAPLPPTMTHSDGRLHPSPLCSRTHGPARIFTRLLQSTAPEASRLRWGFSRQVRNYFCVVVVQTHWQAETPKCLLNHRAEKSTRL